MQQFPCSACGKTISATVAPGALVECPLCHQHVTVPASDSFVPMGAGPTMPRPVGYAGQQYDLPPKQGLAIASLVSGVSGLMICPIILSLPAVIAGIIALTRANREPRMYGGRGLAIGGIVTGALGLLFLPLIIAILLPSLSRARELSKRTVCSANMRGIGSALYIYTQNEPNYAFPDDISKLTAGGNIMAFQFQCPSALPGQQCYYYVPGYTVNSAPNAVLMFEDPAIHQNEGANVLFQDGHVEFVKAGARLDKIIDDNKDKAQ